MRQQLQWLCRPIAHRGLHNQATNIIENTISAVDAAVAANYAIEIDVQPAADFTPIVFHDDMLDRMTEAIGPIHAHSPAALKSVIFKDTQDHMPQLAEILETVSGRVPIIVEVKTGLIPTKNARLRFSRQIRRTLKGYDHQIAVKSFDPRMVHLLARLIPQIPRGLVATNRRHPGQNLTWGQRFRRKHLLWLRMSKADFVAYDIAGLPAIAPFIARKIYKMPLLTWTIRTEDERQKASRWADAIIFEHIKP